MSDTHPDDAFGDWLHAECVASLEPETSAWALERVTRVMARLNAQRPDGRALAVEVLRMAHPTAFTAPGRWIYFGRALLERLHTDEMVAFVLAHEAAHHDCGHLVSLQRGWGALLPANVAGTVVAGALGTFSHVLHGPEREAEADRYAVALCLDAGYDGSYCLQAFDVMENLALDRGDYDGVFGPEALLDPTDPVATSWAGELGRWVWTRGRRYLPLRERKERCWEYLRERSGGRVRGSGRA